LLAFLFNQDFVITREPARDEGLFFKIVRGAFNHRRKTLLNSLSLVLSPLSREEISTLLLSAQISPQRRGETLSLEEFIRLADLVANIKQV